MKRIPRKQTVRWMRSRLRRLEYIKQHLPGLVTERRLKRAKELINAIAKAQSAKRKPPFELKPYQKAGIAKIFAEV